MKKIVRLTESELTNLISKIVNEQKTQFQPDSYYLNVANKMMKNNPKPDQGGKYCFTPKGLSNEIKNQGEDYIKFYKIKKNDTLSHLQSMTDQDSALLKMNPVCNLKSAVKVGDVVIMSMRESM